MDAYSPPPGPVPLPQSRTVHDPTRVRRIEDRGEDIYRQHHQQAYTEYQNLKFTDGPKNIIAQVAKALVDAAPRFAAEHSTYFVPRRLFDRILTLEVVFQIVGKLQCYKGRKKQDCIRLANQIYFGGGPSARAPCRRLLATLVMLGNGSAHQMEAFMAEGMNDQCLPLLVQDSEDNHLLYCRFREHQHSRINSTGENPKQWRLMFNYWSRAVMSPYVIWEEKGLHCHYIMHGGGPLPMKLWTDGNRKQPVHRGGFGQVYKVVLDDGDRSFSNGLKVPSINPLRLPSPCHLS